MLKGKKEMKLILCIVLLPSLCAAIVQNIKCPDGTVCPFGKTCCSSLSGTFECCDIPEEDRMNKKLIAASPPHSTYNESNTLPAGVEPASSFCYDYPTCGGFYCCVYKSGVCCPNPQYCCQSGTRCCSTNYNAAPWCCSKKDRCGSVYGYCFSGTTSNSVTILSVILAFVLATTSKYFL